MSEADPPVGLKLDAERITTGMPRRLRVKVRPSWIRGFIAACVLLAIYVAWSFGHFDAARWVPAPQSPAVPSRSAIAEGVQQPQRPAVRRIDYARIDARLERLAASADMVGMGVAIVENGELSFVKGYGVTSRDADGRPVTAHTVFRWASVSKGVAATLLAKLAGEGRLSLDDPVGRYAKSLKLPGGSEATVSVADLLSHRVGIVHNAYDDKLEEGIDPKAIRTMLGSLDRYCPPSACHAYQNVAFDAASEIVKTVTKRKYRDVVRDRLFGPLGMTSASVTRDGLVQSASWARPHRFGRPIEVSDAYYRVPAAGGVNSSIFDLSIWMLAQMGQAPTILPQPLLDTIHAARVNTERRGRSWVDSPFRETRYAMGWRDSLYDGHRIVAHRGAVDGYRSLILFDPALKSGVAVLWNSESNKPVGLQNEILDMLYGRETEDWMKIEE